MRPPCIYHWNDTSDMHRREELAPILRLGLNHMGSKVSWSWIEKSLSNFNVIADLKTLTEKCFVHRGSNLIWITKIVFYWTHISQNQPWSRTKKFCPDPSQSKPKINTNIYLKFDKPLVFANNHGQKKLWDIFLYKSRTFVVQCLWI